MKIAAALLAWVALLCVPSAVQSQSPQYPDTVLFAGVELGHLVGSQVGHHHAGLLKVKQYALTLDGGIASQMSDALRAASLDVLQKGAAPVIGASRVFASVSDYSGARFVLAGRATFIQINTYGSRAEVGIGVAWELYDAAVRRVVLSRTTTGVAKPKKDETVSGLLAYSLLSGLLSDKSYWAALSQPAPVTLRQPAVVLPVATSSTFRRSVPSEADLLALAPTDRNPGAGETVAERAAQAVFRIVGSRASGTGFLITKDGLALTNHHVVHDQEAMRAILHSGLVVALRVLRSDEGADVALIELACPADCATLEAEDAAPKAGDPLLALGYPGAADLEDAALSATQTVTQGIVSALRRQGGVAILQTDASLNSGNSGGPLLHAVTGRVIGIVAWKPVERGVEGIAFGVSIRDALRVLGFQ